METHGLMKNTRNKTSPLRRNQLLHRRSPGGGMKMKKIENPSVFMVSFKAGKLPAHLRPADSVGDEGLIHVLGGRRHRGGPSLTL